MSIIRFQTILLLIPLLLLASSCQEKKESQQENLVEKSESTLNTKQLTEITHQNLKLIAFTKNILEKVHDSTLIQIANNLQNQHLKINDSLKKIAQKQMVILPDTVYGKNNTYLEDLNQIQDELLYCDGLSKLLEEQIRVYEHLPSAVAFENLKTLYTNSLNDLKSYAEVINQHQKENSDYSNAK